MFTEMILIPSQAELNMVITLKEVIGLDC